MWTETRLKFLADEPIVNGLGEAGSHDDPSWPRYVRTTDIAGPRSLRADTFASLPPEVARRAPLRRGDILMTAAGATIGKSYLHQSDEPACYAGYLVRFRSCSHVDARFVAYWTESVPYWDQIRAGRVISTIENFSAGKYRNLRLCIPSFARQEQIADFLDAETARIGALIEKKRSLSQLLETRFAADLALMIDQLRRTCPLKPLKYIAREIDDRLGTRPEPELLAVSIHHGVVPRSRVTDRPVRVDESSAYKRCLAGDIVLNRMRAFQGAIGRAPVDGIVSPDYAVLRLTAEANPPFMHYVFRSAWFISEMTSRLRGIGTSEQANVRTPRINIEDLGTIRVPLPEPPEQERLASDLDQRIGAVRSLADALERQIDLLREHRQAVITEAVTGQLELAAAVS